MHRKTKSSIDDRIKERIYILYDTAQCPEVTGLGTILHSANFSQPLAVNSPPIEERSL